MKDFVTIWWLRQDLRLEDNPALAWAAEHGQVLAVYIDDVEIGRPVGAASKWWLQQSLERLGTRIPLVIKRGKVEVILNDLIAEHGAKAVVWNRCYEPWAVSRDRDLKALLKEEIGIEVHSFNAGLLHEPWEVKTLGGTEFKVFTPYWKACLKMAVTGPCPAVEAKWVQARSGKPAFYPVVGEPDWAQGWSKIWEVGEQGAQEALAEFLEEKLPGYPDGRDRPDKELTSRLSAHLHFGEIGPRQVWAEAMKYTGAARDKFLSEIGWREFAHHLLWHYPTMVDSNWKRAFDKYPWRELKGDAAKDFEAWKLGKTGYPIVDAGMRQLWQTGWMHNRVRMIVASFLIKHLQIDWREGEKWFWDTLVDADAANNASGWQWVAGSGADASPYFRIFNPFLQGAKFDPNGDYVTKWCPELAGLDKKFIHAPWQAPEMVLRAAGITLGQDYLKPIVDHEKARTAALAGYEKVRG